MQTTINSSITRKKHLQTISCRQSRAPFTKQQSTFRHENSGADKQRQFNINLKLRNHTSYLRMQLLLSDFQVVDSLDDKTQTDPVGKCWKFSADYS